MTAHNLPGDYDADPAPAGDSARVNAVSHSYQEARLPFAPSKVTALPGPPAISKADREALLAVCPHPYAVTLRAMLDLGSRSGRVWARLDVIADRAGVHRATVKRHRAWLVDSAFLAPAGGGYRGRVATYAILTPAARSLALAARREEPLKAAETVEAPPLFDFEALRARMPRRAPPERHPVTCPKCGGTGWVGLVGAGGGRIRCTYRGAGR